MEDDSARLQGLLQLLLDQEDAGTSARVKGRFRSTLGAALRFYWIPAGVNILFLLQLNLAAARIARPWVFIVIDYLLILLVSEYGLRAYNLALKLRARSAAEEWQRARSRPLILYLRSFALDEKQFEHRWYHKLLYLIPARYAYAIPLQISTSTPEQRLMGLLAKYGPVLAIGRPGEKLPPVGAARLYVGDEQWQTVVAQMVEHAGLIVLATGASGGLQWEISHLVKTTAPEKLLLCPHPQLLQFNARRREEEWTQFLEAFGGLFPHPLPTLLGDIQFIRFNEGFDVVPVGPLKQGPFHASLMRLRSSSSVVLDGILSSKGMRPLSLSERLTGPNLRRHLSFFFALLLAWQIVLVACLIVFGIPLFLLMKWYINMIVRLASPMLIT